MKFHLDTAEVFVPDGLPAGQALARTTHMAIGAHQDDLEIMAYDGILRCFQRDDRWFCGVVVTNGSGSPRDDLYRDYSDEQMQVIRRKEQKKAAMVGEYAAQVLLDDRPQQPRCVPVPPIGQRGAVGVNVGHHRRVPVPGLLDPLGVTVAVGQDVPAGM